MFPKWELLFLTYLLKIPMKVVGIQALDELKKNHADTRSSIDNWLAEVRDAKWTSFKDIQNSYNSADYIAPDNIVFDIRHNRYRIWVHVNYKHQIIAIEKAGTHKEYDSWQLDS